MSIIVTAVFTPIDGAFHKVVEALSPAITEVHQEPGCLLYAIHEAPNGQIVMIEKCNPQHCLMHTAKERPLSDSMLHLRDYSAPPLRSPD